MKKVMKFLKRFQRREYKVQKDRTRGISLKTRIIIFFILFSFIPSAIIGNVVYFVSKGEIESKVSEMNEEIVHQVTKNVNNSISELESLILLPISNSDLLNSIKLNSDLSDYEQVQNDRKISEYLQAIQFSNSNVKSLLFLDNEDKFYNKTIEDTFDIDTFYNTGIAEKVENHQGKALWIPELDEEKKVIYLFKKVKGHGTLILAADPAIFQGVFDSTSDSSEREIAIINEENRIVASNNEAIIGADITSNQKNNNNEYLTSDMESSNGWKVSVSTSKSYLLNEINDVIYLVFLIIIGFVLLSVIAGVLLASSMTKPITRIVDLMKQAETGDLTNRAEYVKRNEIGQLGRSFNTMLDNIKAVLNENKRISTYAVDSSHQLKQIATEASEASIQIGAAIEEVAKGATVQVDFAEKTSQEMQMLSDEINDVATNMTKVSDVTSATRQVSGRSIEAIKELTAKNEKMAVNIHQVDQTITALNKEIMQIRNIIEIIKSISDETNLLSLNASIEAARAGEAGRGFSVVAQEIRKLADQSKTSSNKIEKVIEGILLQTEKTVDLVRKSIQLFEEQTESVTDTQQSFESILHGTNSIINEIEFIEESIGKIHKNKETVESSITKMIEIAEISSSTTQEVNATTEEQLASAEELDHFALSLSDTISELQTMINKFKI
nr:methyl-accepting chemotaxis protein [Bacillus sinesaloumensis]